MKIYNKILFYIMSLLTIGMISCTSVQEPVKSPHNQKVKTTSNEIKGDVLYLVLMGIGTMTIALFSVSPDSSLAENTPGLILGGAGVVFFSSAIIVYSLD